MDILPDIIAGGSLVFAALVAAVMATHLIAMRNEEQSIKREIAAMWRRAGLSEAEIDEIREIARRQ